MMRVLQGKVILITGASSGIGAATARLCAEAGMDVTLAARREDRLAEVASAVQAAGRRAQCVACDVRRDADVNALFARHWEAFGRLDVCFANAGYGLLKTVEETTEAEHRDIFETNYWGTIRTLRAAIPSIRNTPEGLRQLIICSSAASEIGLPTFGPYCATKAAQDSIAGALRAELRDEGIHVTGVHPVGTKTEFFSTAERVSGPAAEQGLHTPPGMRQTVDRVAGAIVSAIRRPRAEVWPHALTRLGLAGATAMPELTARIVARRFHKGRAGNGTTRG